VDQSIHDIPVPSIVGSSSVPREHDSTLKSEESKEFKVGPLGSM